MNKVLLIGPNIMEDLDHDQWKLYLTIARQSRWIPKGTKPYRENKDFVPAEYTNVAHRIYRADSCALGAALEAALAEWGSCTDGRHPPDLITQIEAWLCTVQWRRIAWSFQHQEIVFRLP